MPLHGMKNDKGDELVTINRVAELRAMVVKERLAAKMPNCTFGGIYALEGARVQFTYTVPALVFKGWF